MWGSLAFGYMLVSRMTYVIGVGLALTQQERRQHFTRRHGVTEGYERFRRMSLLLMLNDVTAFIVLCVVTANTMHLPVPRSIQVAVGMVISAVGISIKVWATARLGPQSYYWHNFFVPSDPVFPNPPGPYRYLKNPMYGVGYLQTYGFALMCASWPGMIASAFMHISIFVFNALVEKPHLQALRQQAASLDGNTAREGLKSGAAPRVD